MDLQTVDDSLFRAAFQQAPVGIALAEGFILLEVNDEFAKILGYTKDVIKGLSWVDITHPDDLDQEMALFESFLKKEIAEYTIEKRFLRSDGSSAWTTIRVTDIETQEANEACRRHLCIIRDIQEQKKAEEQLRESERSKRVLLSNLPGMAYRCDFDRLWTMRYLSEGCVELTGYEPEDLIDNRMLSYHDVILPKNRDTVWEEFKQIVERKIPFRFEYEILTAQKTRKWVMEIGRGVFDETDEHVIALEGIIIDITESKRRLDRIHYMYTHDYITGLYNRNKYEREKAILESKSISPISVIMADINGIRLINDAFGHEEGDKVIAQTARILRECCRPSDMAARTGGDEFCILLPMTDRVEAYQRMQAIREACARYNETIPNTDLQINLALGFGTIDKPDQSLRDAEKEAEDYVNKNKLFQGKSYHSALLSSITATLHEHSQETEAHAQRLWKTCQKIGERLQLPQNSLEDLHLFSRLHDLGKVGVDDRILNKPGKLTPEEWQIMKRHPAVGYRIAMSAPELTGIAEYILCHHERWDGTGYPVGKAGNEIPLLSRILSVADAYDAMTTDRVYRDSRSSEEAIQELLACAGSQFDPHIVGIFIEIVKAGEL
jgi:diguanylate cyclase (GGDEF)-like protein/PAS domain S-box-containing protein